MEDDNNCHGWGKRKKSNLSINCKSKWYRLENSQSNCSSSQIFDNDSSSGDSNDCNSLINPSISTIKTNDLSKIASQSHNNGMQMEISSVSKSQQTVQKCRHLHILAKPVTFVKSTEALHLSKLHYNSTQTCLMPKDAIKPVKTHSTQTSIDDPISSKYPHMKRIIDN